MSWETQTRQVGLELKFESLECGSVAKLDNDSGMSNLYSVDTEAKIVDFDEDSSEEADGGQQHSRLRKLTSLPLSEGDQRYAGQKTSRSDWLAESGNLLLSVSIIVSLINYIRNHEENITEY